MVTTEEVPFPTYINVTTAQNAGQMYETVPDMDYQDAVSSVPEPTNLASDNLTMPSAPNQNTDENVNPSSVPQPTNLESEYLKISETIPDQHQTENTKMYEPMPDMDFREPVPSALNQSEDENVGPASKYLPMAPGKKAPGQRGADNTKNEMKRQKNECSVSQKHQSEASETYEYIDMDEESEDQMESRHLTVKDDKPYDLPVAGYLNPSAGKYTKLNVNKQNQEDQ